MKQFIIVLLLLLSACQTPDPQISEPIVEKVPEETISEPVEVIEETEESGINILSQGAFEGKAHAAKGNAMIVEENGKKVLKLEGFETDPGPDLFIVLAPGLDGAEGVNLGMLDSFSGDKEYVLDDTVDIEKNKNVLVWCKQYGVLFSSASLT